VLQRVTSQCGKRARWISTDLKVKASQTFTGYSRYFASESKLTKSRPVLQTKPTTRTWTQPRVAFAN